MINPLTCDDAPKVIASYLPRLGIPVTAVFSVQEYNPLDPLNTYTKFRVNLLGMQGEPQRHFTVKISNEAWLRRIRDQKSLPDATDWFFDQFTNAYKSLTEHQVLTELPALT